ncbi:hypothetical protein PV325_010191 [Microctonus aethiopoides]|nr:hypothetical protein PV325_010191 [Microctonus aethiopoides]
MKRNQRKGTVTWRGIRIKSKSELAPEQRISSSSPVVVTGVAGCWIIYARVATTSLLECNSQQRTRQKRISHQAGSRSRKKIEYLTVVNAVAVYIVVDAIVQNAQWSDNKDIF